MRTGKRESLGRETEDIKNQMEISELKNDSNLNLKLNGLNR